MKKLTIFLMSVFTLTTAWTFAQTNTPRPLSDTLTQEFVERQDKSKDPIGVTYYSVYRSINGKTYKLGDTLTLGEPSKNTTYQSLIIQRKRDKQGKLIKNIYLKGKQYVGTKAQIIRIKAETTKENDYMYGGLVTWNRISFLLRLDGKFGKTLNPTMTVSLNYALQKKEIQGPDFPEFGVPFRDTLTQGYVNSEEGKRGRTTLYKTYQANNGLYYSVGDKVTIGQPRNGSTLYKYLYRKPEGGLLKGEQYINSKAEIVKIEFRGSLGTQATMRLFDGGIVYTLLGFDNSLSAGEIKETRTPTSTLLSTPANVPTMLPPM